MNQFGEAQTNEDGTEPEKVSQSAQPSKSGLKVVNPAVLMSLGILAAGVSTPVQAGPAVDDAYNTTMNTPLTGVNVTVNDNVPGNSIASVQIITPPLLSAGTAILDENGALTFTPAPGFTGTATLTYNLVDQSPAPNSVANVTITVAPPVTPVPTLAPAAIGGLGALVTLLAARRRSSKNNTEDESTISSDDKHKSA